jgi:hypothetical protein
VVESFDHTAFHRDRTSFLHIADGRRLKQHNASWLPALCKPGAARARRRHRSRARRAHYQRAYLCSDSSKGSAAARPSAKGRFVQSS